MPQLYANYFPYIFVYCSGYCSASFRYRSIIVPVIRSIGATIGAKSVFIGATMDAIGVILVTLLVTSSDLIVTFSMTHRFFL